MEDKNKINLEDDSEMKASERRSKRLQEIQEELNKEDNNDLADILAQIEANNKKKFD